MIGSIWKSLETQITEMTGILSGVAAQGFASKDISALAQLQQSIIELGNLLEKEYHLEDTQIIHLLEQCCELLFQYTNAPSEEVQVPILQKIKSIPEVFAKTVPEKDLSLSIVLIAKNEGRYIREWLEYHRVVGVEHFYIYDNDSIDGLKEMLETYIRQGIVAYIPWPGKYMQLPAYNHAIEHYKYDTKWMAFIDADEFLVPVTKSTIPEEIDSIFAGYFAYPPLGKAAGIGVNWRVYGTSFHEKPVEGLLIENYTYRGEDFAEKNKCIKTICDPRCVNGFKRNPHEVEYKDGYHGISENGSYLVGPWFPDGRCSHLRLNHYISKSKEEFLAKFAKGKADCAVIDPPEVIEKECRLMEDVYNRVQDDVMEKYVDEVKGWMRQR